jgi:hypothetical protein
LCDRTRLLYLVQAALLLANTINPEVPMSNRLVGLVLVHGWCGVWQDCQEDKRVIGVGGGTDQRSPIASASCTCAIAHSTELSARGKHGMCGGLSTTTCKCSAPRHKKM